MALWNDRNKVPEQEGKIVIEFLNENEKRTTLDYRHIDFNPKLHRLPADTIRWYYVRDVDKETIEQLRARIKYLEGIKKDEQ